MALAWRRGMGMVLLRIRAALLLLRLLRLLLPPSPLSQRGNRDCRLTCARWRCSSQRWLQWSSCAGAWSMVAVCRHMERSSRGRWSRLQGRELTTQQRPLQQQRQMYRVAQWTFQMTTWRRKALHALAGLRVEALVVTVPYFVCCLHRTRRERHLFWRVVARKRMEQRWQQG